MTVVGSWGGSAPLPTVSGSVSLDTTSQVIGPESLLVANDAAAAYARWTFPSTGTLSARLYLKTPAAWPASSFTFLRFMVDGAVYTVGLAIAGSGAPGQLRLLGSSGTTLQSSPNGTLAPSTRYRIEVTFNQAAQRGDVFLFEYGGTGALLWSGSATGHAGYGSPVIRLDIGRTNSSPAVQPWYIDEVVVDDVVTLVGPHADDPIEEPEEPEEPAVPFPFLWSGAESSGLTPTLVGNTTVGVAPVTLPFDDMLVVDQGAATAYAQYQWSSAAPFLASRFYLGMPAVWPSGAWGVATFRPTGSSQAAAFVVSGAGQPGQVRLTTASGVAVATSPRDVVRAGRWYRCEMQQDCANSRARLSVSRLTMKLPLWESGWVSDPGFAAPLTIAQFGRVNSSPAVAPFQLAEVSGRVAGAAPPVWDGPSVSEGAPALALWNGEAMVPLPGGTVSYWNGTTLVPVQF